jgi:hypothetical protein
MPESEPAALTAKFCGWILSNQTVPGPFRVVLLREYDHHGSWYKSFVAPVGQPLVAGKLKLGKAKTIAEEFFTEKLEDWKECEPRKGLPV